MPKFRKNPVVIEAAQWFPPDDPRHNQDHRVGCDVGMADIGTITVMQPDATKHSRDMYPCAQDVFAATYEEVLDAYRRCDMTMANVSPTADGLKHLAEKLKVQIKNHENGIRMDREELAGVEQRIAAAEKPLEKFPVGTQAMIKVEIIVCDSCDIKEGTRLIRGIGLAPVRVRESDLISAPEPLTAAGNRDS